MATPVVGPLNQTTGDSIGTHYTYRQVWRQAKPFDRVLPYQHRGCTISRNTTDYSASGMGGGFDVLQQVDSWSDERVHLQNALYERFKSSISDRAELGVGLAEIGQSWNMVTGRALQLTQFARRLRRLDFSGAARTLRMSTVPKGVSTKKSFANNYLEFHFGWSPLIGDIHSAVNVLQEPIKSSFVRAKVTGAYRRWDLSTPTLGSSPGPTGRINWQTYRYWAGTRSMSCGAEVKVSNPNLWLANQMGLVNPASIAWELIPFSFVVDWFVNVGQVISRSTDFYGLTLTKEWTTHRWKGVTAQRYHETRRECGFWGPGGSYSCVTSSVAKDAVGPLFHIRRLVGLPKPTFALKPWSPWSWRRTAAAVSLLVQQARS